MQHDGRGDLLAGGLFGLLHGQQAFLRQELCVDQYHPVDTLDPKTDGFFCPSCGASGFWKGKTGEIEAKALPK